MHSNKKSDRAEHGKHDQSDQMHHQYIDKKKKKDETEEELSREDFLDIRIQKKKVEQSSEHKARVEIMRHRVAGIEVDGPCGRHDGIRTWMAARERSWAGCARA